MNSGPTCPFCRPPEEDVVVLETDYAHALCDARPVIVGHVLVTPKSHADSVYDLEEPTFSHVRLLQQEISWRLYNAKGEVGVYEHGRSTLCRFHNTPVGYCHAHLHVLPASFDLIARSGYESRWRSKPSRTALTQSARYIHQEMGEYPEQMWAVGVAPVSRHFVRSEFQNLLNESGQSWIPLSAMPDDHDEAIEQTEFLLRAGEASSSSGKKGLTLFGEQETIINGVAGVLSDRTGWQVINADLLYRLIAWLASEDGASGTFRGIESLIGDFSDRAAEIIPSKNTQTGASIRYREMLLGPELFDPQLDTNLQQILCDEKTQDAVESILYLLFDRAPTILTARRAGRRLNELAALNIYLYEEQNDPATSSHENDIHADIPPRVENTHRPRWEDFRLTTNDLNLDQLAELVNVAWRLRFRQGMSAT